MDYRKYYEECTGLKVPDNFDIHHLDYNRENNSIENLVALPRQLHSLYHQLKPTSFNFDTTILSILDQGHASFGFFVEQINDFYSVYEKCCHWLDFRNFLLGKIPDIRNVKEYYKNIN